MKYKLLFDEQLTPELVKLARAAGHVGCTCVRDRGLAGMPDWKLMEFVLEHDFTLVTLNATDFRGRGAAVPGGLYARTELHAGLVCLSSVRPLTLDQQCDAFGAVFEYLKGVPDLVNTVLEVTVDEHFEIAVIAWSLPGEKSLAIEAGPAAPPR